MQWEVKGADRQTGEDRSMTVEATGEDQALKLASAQGMLVSAIAPAASPPPNKNSVAASAAKAQLLSGLVVAGIGALLMLWAFGAFEPKNPLLKYPTVHVTPGELLHDYIRNEVAADQKYKGKLISVTGKIDDLGRDFMNTAYVSMSAPDVDIRRVRFEFDEEGEKGIAALTRGRIVSIKGTCDGLYGNVNLSDCRVDP